MSNLTSILTLHQSAEVTVAWTMQRLVARGFQIVVHGHDDQTSLSLVDMANQSIDESIIQALLSVMENSEI